MQQTKALTRAQQMTTVREYVEAQMPKIIDSCAGALDGPRLLRLFLNSLQHNPKLLDADPFTLCGAVMEASQLGLYLDGITGEAHLLPFRDKKAGKTVVQLVPGYQGVLKLARHSGEILDIASEVVYENDEITVDQGINRQLTHQPYYTLGHKEPGEIIGAYSICWLENGQVPFKYMTLPQIMKHKPYHVGNKPDSPWNTDPAREWMYKKTTLIQLCKMLPKSITDRRLAKAVAFDEAASDGRPQHFDMDISSTVEIPNPEIDEDAPEPQVDDLPTPKKQQRQYKKETPAPPPPEPKEDTTALCASCYDMYNKYVNKIEVEEWDYMVGQLGVEVFTKFEDLTVAQLEKMLTFLEGVEKSLS